jgi:two-component system sensor histidine kinase PilS (NtrC family)
LATVLFLIALLVTAGSFWYTHMLGREPSENFLYAQVILDVFLVTGIVHATGGPDSGFASIYILVISAGALLLPLPGGVLIGGLASMVYFADLAWGYQGAFTIEVGLRIGLFTIVALLTGFLGDRLRRAGQALGAVASELRQLRLDTGDILANLSTGVITVDGAGRLAYANPAADVLLGLDLQDLLGRPVLADIERVAPGMGQVLRRTVDDGRPLTRFRTAVSRNGDPIRLGVSSALLDRGEDEAPSATAIFEDITDLERLDELNVRAERLEAVAELSASLAHEIKNPLASIRSAVEQLSGKRVDADDRGVLQRVVINESDRLSRLLSEFLDYSVLKLGSRTEIDLCSTVRECLRIVRQHPDVGAVDLKSELADGPVPVLGDSDLLHRALFNLVLNGAQSAGPGGSVVVSVENDRGEVRSRGMGIEHPVRLSVRDSGAGVDPDLLSRIFDPFFTTKKEGSGLGLAVVHRAVEAHAGVTLVERAPEGGAEFVILRPGVSGTSEVKSSE